MLEVFVMGAAVLSVVTLLVIPSLNPFRRDIWRVRLCVLEAGRGVYDIREVSVSAKTAEQAKQLAVESARRGGVVMFAEAVVAMPVQL